MRAFIGAGDTMVVHTKTNTILTAVGTLIATTETMTQGSWGATTLADGTDGTNITFSVAGTTISAVFASGYSTVGDFEAALAADSTVTPLITVKTAGTTPLYQLVVTDDDFSATALTGGGTTASAAPAPFTDGTSIGVAMPHLSDQAVILLRSVAGTGTLTATVRLWGYFPSTGFWYALGTGTNQGYINGGVAVGEISTVGNTIAQAEGLSGLRRCTRLYAEIIGALGGTGTEVELWADCIRTEPVTVS